MTREDTRSKARSRSRGDQAQTSDANRTQTPGGEQVQQREWSEAPKETTGWVGWVAFAAVVMIMMGTFHAVQGLVALFQESYYLVGETGLVWQVDYTAWGWIHLVLGIVVLCAGFALFTGQLWARVVALALAFVSAFANVVFLAAYPLWSLTMIALDVLVIWAVTVHGEEMKVRRA
jgi:hypothetical protein